MTLEKNLYSDTKCVVLGVFLKNNVIIRAASLKMTDIECGRKSKVIYLKSQYIKLYTAVRFVIRKIWSLKACEFI